MQTKSAKGPSYVEVARTRSKGAVSFSLVASIARISLSSFGGFAAFIAGQYNAIPAWGVLTVLGLTAFVIAVEIIGQDLIESRLRYRSWRKVSRG